MMLLLLKRNNVLRWYCIQVICHYRLNLVDGRHKSLIVKLSLLGRHEFATTFGGQKRCLGWWVRIRTERSRTIWLKGLVVQGWVLKEGGNVLLDKVELLVGHEALVGARSKVRASRENIPASLDWLVDIAVTKGKLRELLRVRIHHDPFCLRSFCGGRERFVRIRIVWSENQRLLELYRLRYRCFLQTHVCFIPSLSNKGWWYNHLHYRLVAWDIMRRLVHQ